MSPEPWLTYLVAGCAPWARRIFGRTIQKLPGHWLYVDHPALLETPKFWQTNTPRYAFFLYWRWVVPTTVLHKTECIGFHLGGFAQECGGASLSQQIAAGKSHSVLTMFRLGDEPGLGAVYATHAVRLFGSAEAIYTRAMEDAAVLIAAFIRAPWAPALMAAGAGGVVRTPGDTRLPSDGPLLRLDQVYNQIRLADAEGEPPAFLDYGGCRYTFRRAVQYNGRIEADVKITSLEEGDDSHTE